MTPLVSAPLRGYADWQRLSNYDSGVLFNDPGTTTNGNITTPIIDVSRYAYLGGWDFTTAGQALVIVNWFSAVDGLSRVGTRQFALDSNLNFPAQYRLPNLAPFVQVQWTSIFGAAYTHQATIIGTNRAHPLEFVPVNQVLIDQQNVNIGAGVTDTFFPTSYHSGPANVWMFTGANVFWKLQALTPDQGWVTIDQITATTVQASNQRSTVCPPGAWRMQVTNQAGAAQNVFFVVTPSLTGSS